MSDLSAHSRLRAGTALVIAALVALSCSQAQAGGRGHRHPRPRPAIARPAVVVTPPAVKPPAASFGSSGMIIARDPETGALVPPSAAQVLRLTAAERNGLLRGSEGLTQVRLADGTVMVDLQGRFMEYSVLRLDLQGRPHFGCVDDERALLGWLTSRPPAPTTPSEEK